MFKYSIIVPVYNAEEFIDRCVQSIIRQTYKEYEIILIDDGSVDQSPEICDKLEETYPQKIKTVHCKNGGTSRARNLGIQHATGDYIGFVDNDDFWYTDNGLKAIDDRLCKTQADAIVYKAVIYNDNEDKIYLGKNKTKSKEIEGKNFFDATRNLIKKGIITSAVWTKFVKRSIVVENQIFFPENMRNEDTDWTAKLFRHISSIDFYDKDFYVYRKGNEYSQTSKPIKREHVDDLKKIILDNIEFTGLAACEETRKKVIFNFLSYPYVVWLSQISFFSHIEKDISEMKEFLYILKCSSRPYVKLVYLACRIIGIKQTMKILNLMIVKKYPFLKESGK